MSKLFATLSPAEMKGITSKGNYAVVYDGCLVEMSPERVAEARDYLSAMSRHQRRAALKSAIKSMDGFVDKYHAKEPFTEQERQEFCTDVCIYFAEAVRTGEAKDSFIPFDDPSMQTH